MARRKRSRSAGRRRSRRRGRGRSRTRKSVPWAGWGRVAPFGRARTTMLKRCGRKCFLGPRKSFPICSKGTCKVNKKGLWAAYIRAREWGKKASSYKSKAKTIKWRGRRTRMKGSRPRHRRGTYQGIQRRAKRMLNSRGVKVGGGSNTTHAGKSKLSGHAGSQYAPMHHATSVHGKHPHHHHLTSKSHAATHSVKPTRPPLHPKTTHTTHTTHTSHKGTKGGARRRTSRFGGARRKSRSTSRRRKRGRRPCNRRGRGRFF